MKGQLTRLAHVNKFRFALLALLALMLNSVPLFNRNAALAQSKSVGKGEPHGLTICPLQFEATVHQGTNAEKFSLTGVLDRSEERRVGKEGRSRVLDKGFKVPLHGKINGRA